MAIPTSGCVVRLPRMPFMMIRSEYIIICGAKMCAAALLSFFEHWHDQKLAEAEQANIRGLSVSLLQWHTQRDLEEGVMHLYKRDSIRVALIKLAELGFVTAEQNPDKRAIFDHTKFFLFHPEQVNKSLKLLIDENSLPPVGIVDRRAENRSSGRAENRSSGRAKNRSSSSQITSKIPTKSRETQTLTPSANAKRAQSVLQTSQKSSPFTLSQNHTDDLQAPFDAIDELIPEKHKSPGERFIEKTCGTFAASIAVKDWKFGQEIKEYGALLNGKLNPEKLIGGSPKLFREFWFNVINRDYDPRPKYIVEQWDAYDRWLAVNHPTMSGGAQGA